MSIREALALVEEELPPEVLEACERTSDEDQDEISGHGFWFGLTSRHWEKRRIADRRLAMALKPENINRTEPRVIEWLKDLLALFNSIGRATHVYQGYVVSDELITSYTIVPSESIVLRLRQERAKD